MTMDLFDMDRGKPAKSVTGVLNQLEIWATVLKRLKFTIPVEHSFGYWIFTHDKLARYVE